MKTIFTLLLIFAVCCSLNAQNLNKHLNVDVNIKKKPKLKYSNLSYSKSPEVKPLDLSSFKEAGNAIIETADALQKRALTNENKAHEFLNKVMTLEVPENCEEYKKALIRDVIRARDNYIEEKEYIIFADDIDHIMYQAYLQSPNLKRIKNQITLNELEHKYTEQIHGQVINGILEQEIKEMCQVVIPVLKELKTEHIDSICFDLITVLSLEGYIKGSNNYLGIKQQTSIRAVKRTDFPDLPAKYLSVRDFTLDFYDLYVKKNVGIFEETAAINLYRKLIKKYYSQQIVQAILNL